MRALIHRKAARIIFGGHVGCGRDVLGVQVLAGNAKATHESTGARAATTLSPGQLDAIAQSLAANSGDASPTNVEAAQTTHAAALAVMEPGAPYGGFGPGDAAVDVITMTGHFTAYRAHV